MNSIIEVSKLEPEPTFEKTIDEIKNNHLKSIASAAINLSDITNFGDNFDPLSMNRRIEVKYFEPEPTFENTINEIRSNHLRSITSIDMNVSAITLNQHSLSYEHLKYDIMTCILLQSPGKSPQFTKYLSSMHPKVNPQLKFENGGFLLDLHYIYSVFLVGPLSIAINK